MKKLLCCVLAAAMLCTVAMANNPEITTYTDPETGEESIVYAGDPAVLLDDDGTIYLYMGQDAGDGRYYVMPHYLCYSSTDLMNWKYEGIPLSAGDFSWGSPNDSWASQVIKYNGMYYFYISKNATGISVGVSDSPTGPFTDARNGVKLIEPGWTKGNVSWDDIDPTVWVETDADGVEHRYLCWGNGNVYMAELNTDMISLMDRNGDGVIDGGDIDEVIIEGIPTTYTEAPWIYKRDGLYYLFFATNWREDLSYATAENIWGPYQYKGLVMNVGASSNTNHPAVLDFNGETYIIYHTGAQERGGGYLRSVCIDRLVFDENGGVAQLEESSIGLDGDAVKLLVDGETVFHTHFPNSHSDADYPQGGMVRLGGDPLYETDSQWEIVPGKIPGENHVSIQSVNKIGYFVTDQRGFIKLLHDGDGTVESRIQRTFVMKETENGTTFESLYSPDRYLAVDVHGYISLADEPAYFTLRPTRLRAQVSAASENGQITVTAVGDPEVTAIVIVRGHAGTQIGYGHTDVQGRLSYSFTPASAGEYEIYCLGKTVKVSFGGAE